jgi:hypothetical protein
MKTKISRFEYAIRTVAEPETLDEYEQFTREEELDQRIEKMSSQMNRLTVIKPTENENKNN